MLGDAPLDFMRAGRAADELVNRVAQLEGAFGDPGNGPGQEGPLLPQPGGGDGNPGRPGSRTSVPGTDTWAAGHSEPTDDHLRLAKRRYPGHAR